MWQIEHIENMNALCVVCCSGLNHFMEWCSGSVFLVCEDLGRMFDNLFPAYALFFSQVEIGSHTLIPLFGQDQSTVA